MTTEAARQAARELAEQILLECAVITASDHIWLGDLFAQAFDTFAAAQVEKAVAAERERIVALTKQLEGYRNEREEEYAALRRRRIRFVRFNGVLEAIRLDDDVPDFQPDEPTTKGHDDE